MRTTRLSKSALVGALLALCACGDGDERGSLPEQEGCRGAKCDDAEGDEGVTDRSYDFIVVGSGAGGGPLAANLARAGFSVLLLEAGLDVGDKDVYKIPAWHPLSTEDEDMRWDYFVDHFSDASMARRDDKFEEGPDAENTGVFYPRAGALGGCTAHNAMITVVPHDSDWDKISDLFDGEAKQGWSAANMQQYFGQVTRWLNVESPSPALAIGDFKLKAVLLAGVKEFVNYTEDDNFFGLDLDIFDVDEDVSELAALLGRDINAPEHRASQGVYPFQIATDNGERTGTREFLLETAEDFDLTIKTGALVTNAIYADALAGEGSDCCTTGDGGSCSDQGCRDAVTAQDSLCGELWDSICQDVARQTGQCGCDAPAAGGGDPRVVGVEFFDRPHLYNADPRAPQTQTPETKTQVFADNEVIISAGTFNSPQLLKLSGIGPREELESLGIDVKANLPGVGKNLQDRYEMPVISAADRLVGPGDTPFAIREDCTFAGGPSDPCYQDWKEKREGVYTSNGGAMAMIVHSDEAEGPDPDLFIFGVPGRFGGYEVGYSEDVKSFANQFTWLVLKGHTRNTDGEIVLRSVDPRERPVINFKNFGDPRQPSEVGGKHLKDVDAMVDAVELMREIMGHADNLMIPLNRDLDEDYPGEQINTEREIRDWVIDNSWGHHACCTNKIGADDDPMAVLDEAFRVRGVDGLRVVDASVFPEIPGFFIVTPIYMASEYASDLLIEEYGRERNPL